MAAAIRWLYAGALVCRGMEVIYPCESCFCRESYQDEDIQEILDIPYGSAMNKWDNWADDEEILLLDLYLPPASDVRAARPAIVLLFAGDFQKFQSIADMKRWSRYFAQRGLVAALAKYRLSRGNPDQYSSATYAMQDGKAAVRWVRSNETLNVDTGRIAVFGVSGGGMAAALLSVLEDEGMSGNSNYSSDVSACVALSAYLPLPNDRILEIEPTDVPYWNFHGADDMKVQVARAEASAILMTHAGMINHLTKFEGEGHTPFQKLHEHMEDIMGFYEEYMTLREVDCPEPPVLAAPEAPTPAPAPATSPSPSGNVNRALQHPSLCVGSASALLVMLFMLL